MSTLNLLQFLMATLALQGIHVSWLRFMILVRCSFGPGALGSEDLRTAEGFTTIATLPFLALLSSLNHCVE